MSIVSPAVPKSTGDLICRECLGWCCTAVSFKKQCEVFLKQFKGYSETPKTIMCSISAYYIYIYIHTNVILFWNFQRLRSFSTWQYDTPLGKNGSLGLDRNIFSPPMVASKNPSAVPSVQPFHHRIFPKAFMHVVRHIAAVANPHLAKERLCPRWGVYALPPKCTAHKPGSWESHIQTKSSYSADDCRDE